MTYPATMQKLLSSEETLYTEYGTQREIERERERGKYSTAVCKLMFWKNDDVYLSQTLTQTFY